MVTDYLGTSVTPPCFRKGHPKMQLFIIVQSKPVVGLLPQRQFSQQCLAFSPHVLPPISLSFQIKSPQWATFVLTNAVFNKRLDRDPFQIKPEHTLSRIRVYDLSRQRVLAIQDVLAVFWGCQPTPCRFCAPGWSSPPLSLLTCHLLAESQENMFAI